MNTHCDDSCQQHRGKYQYIVDDLVSHTTAIVLVGRCVPSMQSCSKSHFSFRAIVLFCCSAAVTLYHNKNFRQQPEIPSMPQSTLCRSKVNIRVQKYAVGYVRLLSIEQFVCKVSSMQINKQTPQFDCKNSAE